MTRLTVMNQDFLPRDIIPKKKHQNISVDFIRPSLFFEGAALFCQFYDKFELNLK